ncbi:MAG: rod-binding protein [Firmicutes bacterium]|nr:rod-binding protein [Bacillota bacterium]
MRIEGVDPRMLSTSAKELPSVAGEDKRLKDACKQYESVFLNQLMSEMRKTIPKSGLMGGEGEEGGEGGESNEKEMYDSMMDTEMANAWASSEGVGLANILYQQMKQSR